MHSSSRAKSSNFLRESGVDVRFISTMPLPHHYRIYSDESCINQAEYIIIGATVGAPGTLARMARDIDALPTTPGVMKWDKIKNGKIDRYLSAIDIFFDYNSRRAIDFHCLVIEARHVNYRKHSGGDSELGFGKFMFQLYLSMKSRYGAPSNFHCFPDFRDTKYDLQSLKQALNRRLTKASQPPDRSFREIEWCNEQDCRAAQINDLLTGATGFIVNGRSQTGKDQSKQRFAKHVLDKSPHTTFSENSRWSEWHYRVWHYELER